MQWNLIRFDETRYWSDDIQARATAVWGVYAYTPEERTRCAEITPSYCLHRLGAVEWAREGLSDQEREQLNEDVLEGSAHDEPVTYMHCSRVDAVSIVDLKERTAEATHVACGEFNEGPEHDPAEYVREWWNGNPIW